MSFLSQQHSSLHDLAAVVAAERASDDASDAVADTAPHGAPERDSFNAPNAAADLTAVAAAVFTPDGTAKSAALEPSIVAPDAASNRAPYGTSAGYECGISLSLFLLK